jgi:hypothetical protein
MVLLKNKILLLGFGVVIIVLAGGGYILWQKNIKAEQIKNSRPVFAVPDTSASAITSPPPSMVGINTHMEVYGTDADPNIITLGPKLGSHPNYKTYPGKRGMEFELKHGTPLLAPIDMVLIGFSDASANYRIQEGQKNTPFNDLMLWFESASPDWPGMIIFVIIYTAHTQLTIKWCSEVESGST